MRCQPSSIAQWTNDVGDIDDVIRAAHDPEVTILIFVTCVRGQVVSNSGSDMDF
jgi:hypothetical protein